MATLSQADREFLATAHQRFQTAAEAEATFRAEALEDLNFRAGDQWPESVKALRLIDKRPCLTIDKISGPIRQVVNQQRQAKLAIDVVPVADGATTETAEVIQGLVRAIEVQSQAPHVYAWAFEQAVTTGLGYWRVLTDYASDASFDQDLKIQRILNPFAVYYDPATQEPDGSDAAWCFVVEDLDKADFEAKYGKDEAPSLEEYRSLGDDPQEWFPEGRVRVAEYWYAETVRTSMAQLATGEVVEAEGLPEGVPILAMRDVDARVVKWAKICATKVLERADWPGKYIPVVPVYGEEMIVDGERLRRGLVRTARDPQRMYNYWVSAETEAIALAPRAPWVAAEGQFEGHEAEWRNAHLRNIPTLEYKPTTLGGQALPPPQRQIAEPPIQALVMAIQQADADIKATTGIWDASLGRANASDRSGRAIQALQRQGETANSNYLDNLALAIGYTGRILVDLLPAIYDRPGRIARVLQQDGQANFVALNAPFVPGPQGMPQVVPPSPMAQSPGGGPFAGAWNGAEVKQYDLAKGRYAVTVQVGPSYNTQRQEAVASMMQLIEAFPAMAPVVGDLVVSEMDWPGAKSVSERLKKMLPPQLQEQQGQQTIPPQVQQQLQQAGQMIEQLTAALTETQKLVDTQAAKAQADLQAQQMKTQADLAMKQAEIQSKERIAAMQVQAELVQLEAQLNVEKAKALLTEQLATTREMFKADVARTAAIDAEDREDERREADRDLERERMTTETAE